MSDKPKDAKADAAPADAHGAAKKKGGMGALLTKLPVLLGGVMVIEAGLLFGAFKMFGGGAAPVAGAELHADGTGAKGDDDEGEEPAAAAASAHGGGEGGSAPAAPTYAAKRKYTLPVIEFRAPNKVSGRMFLYDVQIDAQVLGANAAKVKSKLESRKALISDRVRTIIAQSDPEKLNGQAEPGLETLKRQVKYQLEEIVGDGLIDEVLVPRCIPFRADF